MTTANLRFDLPDGEWADLRPAKKIPERLRRPVRLAAIALQRSLPEDQRMRATVKASDALPVEASEETQAAFGVPPIESLAAITGDEAGEPEGSVEDLLPTEEQIEATDSYNEAVILAFVAEWSFGPVSAETLRDLPGDAFDALIAEVRRLNSEEGGEDSLDSDPSSP